MNKQLLWGTLEMLILDVVSHGPTYGYAITQTVLDRSQGYFDVKEGSLYPALHRMEKRKLLSSYWVDTQVGRRRKYYKLTADGKKMLAEKKQDWDQFSNAIGGVLGHSLVTT